MKNALLLTALLLFACSLTGTDETKLTLESSQDNTRLIAIRGGSDTLIVLAGSGARSADVAGGDDVTVYVYLTDISGDEILYTTKEYTITAGQSVTYRL